MTPRMKRRFHVPLARRLEQVERLGRGREQQHRVGLAALGAIVQRQRRLVEGAGDRAIGLLIVFRRQLRFRPLPQCARRIDLALLALFCLELDRKLDVVGIGADDPFDLVSFQIFFCVGFQVQNDFRAARDARCILLARRGDIEAVSSRRYPCPDLACSGAAAGDDDAIGDHEGRVKPDPELADQAGAVRSARWCRDCRSAPAGPCRCRCRSRQACPPSCRARCGFWAARRRRSDRGLRWPRSAACRGRRRRSRSAREGKCRSPNKPSAPSGSTARPLRPEMAYARQSFPSSLSGSLKLKEESADIMKPFWLARFKAAPPRRRNPPDAANRAP